MDNSEGLKNEIARLKSIIEEQKDTIKQQNDIIKEYQAKEQTISSAISFAVERSNQLEDSRRKLYELDLQRSRLLYIRMEKVLSELYAHHPQLRNESKLKEMTEKFKSVVNNPAEITPHISKPQSNFVSEDPIRKLLNNIITFIDDDKEVKTLPRQDGVVINGMEEYLNSPKKSGFDINEALNPTEKLEDILKSFDLNKRKRG